MENRKGPFWGLVPVEEGGYKEKVKEGEYVGNII
jgi:hypothetical protein